MNQHKILVRKITHLTDARYFAAMGVDWISIELNADPASFFLWHTLKDWVEGVKLAAEISMPDETLLAKTIIDAYPDGIILNSLIVFDMPPDIQVFYDMKQDDRVDLLHRDHLIIEYDPETNKNLLQNFDRNKIFLQSDWTPGTLDQLLESGYGGGICFSGGDEETKGMRDYAIMDDMLGRLLL
ncbi:MAG: hypothetical protein ABIQ02_11755 [Saprospiraceae bacterium]